MPCELNLQTNHVAFCVHGKKKEAPYSLREDLGQIHCSFSRPLCLVPDLHAETTRSISKNTFHSFLEAGAPIFFDTACQKLFFISLYITLAAYMNI